MRPVSNRPNSCCTLSWVARSSRSRLSELVLGRATGVASVTIAATGVGAVTAAATSSAMIRPIAADRAAYGSAHASICGDTPYFSSHDST